MTPTDRKYARTHEWVRDDNGIAVVGITAQAQDQLGDMTFIDLPRVGTSVTAGTECMTLESVKAASDVYAPVSGVVAEVNPALEDDPGLVNRDPYGQGWLFKVRDFDSAGMASLLEAAAYDAVAAEPQA